MTRARLLALGSLTATATILTSSCTLRPHDGREANTLEFAYEYLAPGLRMPEICEKISPRAYLAASMSPRGSQIDFTRSSCYHNLALETGQPTYCSKVIPVSTLLLDGSRNSEAECRKDVAAGHGLQSVGGNIDWTMRFMGFTSADSGYGWVQRYYALRSTDSLRTRALDLPDFTVRNEPVRVGTRYEELGCTRDDSSEWYCYAYRCLASPVEEYRQACLEIAEYLETRQQEEAEGRPFEPTGHIADLFKKYPALKPL